MDGDDFDDVMSSALDSEGGEGEDAATADGESSVGLDDQEDAEFDFKEDSRIGQTLRHLLPAEAEKQIEFWHKMLLPVEADLIAELDGQNLFFIHAESLIFDLLDSDQIKFSSELQFLPLTFALEQVLHRVRNTGGTFRLIFFDCCKGLFTNAYNNALWAFRQAFLLHCKTTGVDHAVFSDWYSTEWKQHVNEWRPTFYLLSNRPVNLVSNEDEGDDETPKWVVCFQALMLRCLGTGSHVAIVRGLQFRGNRIMAFTVAPELHCRTIDRNAQEVFSQLFESEREEEDEQDFSGLPAELQAFAKKLGSEVPENAVLRSFLAVKFAQQALEKCPAQDPTATMIKLLVKVVVVSEMLIRQIPLEKRAFATFDPSDWELYEGQIVQGLDNYFESTMQVLGALCQQTVEGVPLDAHDIFDGRIFRHIFHFCVDKALGKKGKGSIDLDMFGFQGFVREELEALWALVGTKEPLFPIKLQGLADLQGIAPPKLPKGDKGRDEPELLKLESVFLEELQKGTAEVKHVVWIEEYEAPAELQAFKDKKSKGLGWVPPVHLDVVKEQEFMEKNPVLKAMEERLRAKTKNGGFSKADLDYLEKFQNKRKQFAIRALKVLAKSLVGSSGLHKPIIVQRGGVEVQEKQSKKSLEMQAKLEKERQEKKRKADEDKYKEWEPDLEKMAEEMEIENLTNKVLDTLLGFTRITESFVGFPHPAGAFHFPEFSMKVVLKVIRSINKSFKKMRLDKFPAEKQPKVRQMVCHCYCIVQECMNTYGKLLDGKAVKMLQETLLGLNFPKTAAWLFDAWLEKQQPEESKGDDGDGDEKKGKDDKKGKKDDKADKKDKKDKKEDKKDKKDDKKDKKDGKDEGPESFKVTKSVELLWSGVGEDEFSFQLRHLGPHMTRTVGTAKDPKERVLFKPDGWQRQLLDIVDEKRSALVVAPTASGKTFIGYYVMDQVLREDDEGVAVYVAPSKALVNQASAEVFARFSGKNYDNPKTELLGVFTREFNLAGGFAEQGRWKSCQVLITEPNVLEMLLLSPTHQDWVSRLRWIIFDEVHCIGGEDGLLWEHCLQIAPCPFIALSATVAKPTNFSDWLTRISEKKRIAKRTDTNPEVELVIHTERWNDLYKYIYRSGELKPLHPFCCLMHQAVKLNGLATDLSLTPQEMVQLQVEVGKIVGKDKRWTCLSPAKFFADKCGFITKKYARQLEAELKRVFVEMVQDGTIGDSELARLRVLLQGDNEATFQPPARTAKPIEDDVEASTDAPTMDEGAEDFTTLGKSNGYLRPSTLRKVCQDLDNIQALPCIMFNFDRREIGRMLLGLVKELKDRQHDKYYGDQEREKKSKAIMKKRWDDYEAKKAEYEQKLKERESKNQEAKASRANADEGDRGAVKDEATTVTLDIGDPPPKPTDLADEIDPEFTFHSVKALGLYYQEIDETLKGLKVSPVLLDGLKRGIGMHHEGCNSKYKQAVEVLFRQGYLKVVFATGTLALGINVPCRTTVFCGDTMMLSGLMYRQMSGRAGRRGYDLMGQVVFLDMAFLKIRSLLASDCPPLTGQFVQSPSTLLRALHQWEIISLEEQKGNNPLPKNRSMEIIARDIAPLFFIPFFRSSRALLDLQVAYHTRFSADLLLKEDLLMPNGYTKGLANLVTHLYEYEPANLILARLLGKGLLHRFLERAAAKEVKADRKTHVVVRLTAVLAWFFCRMRLPDIVRTEKVEQRKNNLPSELSPRLPPLPEAKKDEPSIAEEVRCYNESVFNHMQELAWSVSSTVKLSTNAEAFAMPLSGKAFRQGWDKRGMPFDSEVPDAAFEQTITKKITKYRARTPFSAISGNGDEFLSPADLVSSARNIVHLDMNALPTVAAPLLAGPRQDFEPSNSYLVDFMIHGKIRYLNDDNGIGPTRAFKLLSDFKEAVKKTRRCLEVFAPAGDLVFEQFIELHKQLDKRIDAESA